MATKKLDDDQDDVVIKRDPEIVKREEAELAKKKTDELAKKRTGELAQETQPIQREFTLEEYAWLVAFVLAILVSTFLPLFLSLQFLHDHQISFLLFIVAPIMTWFVRLVYIDKNRRQSRKISS